MIKRQPKQLSNKHEAFIADKFEGKTVIASGALYFAKGDVISPLFLIECKATQKDYYIIKRKIVAKIQQEATKCGRLALLAIRILDEDFILFKRKDYYLSPPPKDSECSICVESLKVHLNSLPTNVKIGEEVWVLKPLDEFLDFIQRGEVF